MSLNDIAKGSYAEGSSRSVLRRSRLQGKRLMGQGFRICMCPNHLGDCDKCVLITGSSRGIGRAIALKLAESRVKVAIHYYKNEEAANDDPVYPLDIQQG